MPTLEDDRLVFRFPAIEEEASFSIELQRTLRIPDTEKTYDLPPGLGRFPLRHAEDHAAHLPAEAAARGGVILPMWQAEAMWLDFSSRGPDWDLLFPVAIKVAAGKINAVTGEPWRPGLHRGPQDYAVAPPQPWLDGFAVDPGVIHQFVAMPLGEGYTVEGQVTGKEEWGGLQIQVIPLKAAVWHERRRRYEEEKRRREEDAKRRRGQIGLRLEEALYDSMPAAPAAAQAMGLAAGGRMKQEIYADTFSLEDWDVAAADRVFLSLLHAKDWKAITGEAAPNTPPSAADYARAGLPWFDYYGGDQSALPGSTILSGVKSLGSLFKQKTGADLPGSKDVVTGAPTKLGPRVRPVRAGKW